MCNYQASHWTYFFKAAVLFILSVGSGYGGILEKIAKQGRCSGFSAILGIRNSRLIYAVFAIPVLPVVLDIPAALLLTKNEGTKSN